MVDVNEGDTYIPLQNKEIRKKRLLNSHANRLKVIFQILAAANIKMIAFWYTRPCRPGDKGSKNL